MYEQNFIFFIAKIIYPNYQPIWFIIYLYLMYYSVFKRDTLYSIVILTDDLMFKIVKDSKRTSDINNCVIVNPDHIYPNDRILFIYDNDTKTYRKVFVVPCASCKKQKLYISNTLFYNYFLKKTDFDYKLVKKFINRQYAEKIELSPITTNFEMSNLHLAMIQKGYFKDPKLIRKGDIVSINLKEFVPQIFYDHLCISVLEKVYFKCDRVIMDGKEVNGEQFCAVGRTLLPQHWTYVQSYIPRIVTTNIKSEKKGVYCFPEISLCPSGLLDYMDKLDDAVYPFLSQKNLKLKPVFLIRGPVGCGNETMINCLALQLGVHHLRVNNADLMANVYAQQETKIDKLLSSAQKLAPCIVSIHNFEVFGKNNEGQYDPRSINIFKNFIKCLFDSNNSFPIILFCCTSSKQISAEFMRMFLEIIEIEAPTAAEREEILSWLLIKNNIQLEEVDLVTVATETQGLCFEDLKALVYYAERNFYQRQRDVESDIVLIKEDFRKAIEFMQSNYKESLGAPKVPKVQWSDIGGLNEVKEEIIKTINLPLKHPEIFMKSGLSRTGILLFGPPGTGKTLIAKAVATECHLCFLSVKGPELLNMYIGQSEENIREVFERARQAAPCIIFFDELDSLAPNRGISADSSGVMDRIVSQLLAEMDGLDISKNVFIIGATNRPDLIDPALLRPGRFDKLLYVGPCTDVDSKLSVLQALTKKFQLSEEVNLNDIVLACPQNITGADLYGICSNAWSFAVKRLIQRIDKGDLNSANLTHQDVIVGKEDFEKAIHSLKPSIKPEDLRYFENLQKELGYSASNEIS